MKHNLFWNLNTLWNQSRVVLMIGHRWRTIRAMLPVSQRSSYSYYFSVHRLLAYEERALDYKLAGLLLLNCTTFRETAWPLWALHSLSSKVRGQMEEIPLFFPDMKFWQWHSTVMCSPLCCVLCCTQRHQFRSEGCCSEAGDKSPHHTPASLWHLSPFTSCFPLGKWLGLLVAQNFWEVMKIESVSKTLGICNCMSKRIKT